MMAGIVWFVQVDHYPLMARIGPAEFPAWEQAHRLISTLLMGPIMILEAATGVALTRRPPPGVAPVAAWGGLVLIALVWGSTAFIQLPLHAALSRAFDAKTHASLVSTNWIRTAGWSLRGLLVLWMLQSVPRSPTTVSLDVARPPDV
jgi:hypothetical protein